MFGMNNQFVGPMSMEEQGSDLRKNKMLANLLQQQSQQASQNQSPDATSGGINIANGMLSGLGAAYLMSKNGQDENLLKRNRMMAGMLGGGSDV